MNRVGEQSGLISSKPIPLTLATLSKWRKRVVENFPDAAVEGADAVFFGDAGPTNNFLEAACLGENSTNSGNFQIKIRLMRLSELFDCTTTIGVV